MVFQHKTLNNLTGNEISIPNAVDLPSPEAARLGLFSCFGCLL